MPITTTRYGGGGFIPGASNGNVVEVTTINDDGTVTVTDGAGTVLSSSGATPRTLALVAADTQTKNADSLRTILATQIAAGSPARNAVATNTTYIGAAKPGTAAAQASAAYDQAKALSQQNNVIIPTLLRTIRLLLGALDDTA